MQQGDSTLKDDSNAGDISRGLTDVEVLITAEEAYPEMERAFLAAKSEIWAGYRVFDLATKLRSPEGQAIGETWFDLIVHVLERGVAVRMVLSDFDPIVGPKLHRASWRARRAFIAAAEVAGPKADLRVINASHSARMGWLPRVLLWPRTLREVSRLARSLNALSAEERAKRIECSPGLRPWLNTDAGGTLSARKFPPPPLVPGTHHQKLAVFDRDLLCIGGLDLDERRYDNKDHSRARDETWHDVQVLCRGPVVAEAQGHLEQFLGAVANKTPPSKTRHLLRTLSRRRKIQIPFLGPRPLVDELYQAHLDHISQAQQLIYFETQFFRDLRIAEALARAADTRPDLGLIVVLPAAPEDVAFDGNTSSDARFGEYQQASCVQTVRNAFGPRVGLFSPARPLRMTGSGRDTLHKSPIIYVHAKVSIFDDKAAIVSSANLNARSLSWDTEAGVTLDKPSDVTGLRQRVFQHWLWPNAPEDYFDPVCAVARWRALAQSNAEAEPSRRKGFLLPHDSAPAEDFGRRLPGVPHALV